MKKSILYILFITGSGLMAQTNPSPVIVTYPTPYIQNFDVLDGSSVTYPAGIQGGRVASSAPSTSGRLTPATLDYTLRAGGSAGTTAAGVWDYNGKIGFHSDAGADASFLLALNTTSIPANEQINVKFDASVMRNLYDATTNSFVCGLAFMYRVGTTDNFTLIDNSFINNENAPQSTSGNTPVRTVNASFNLPLACSNQPVVQIRWIMRAVSGTALSGGANRPNFAIDNIAIRGISTLPVSFTSLISKLSNQGIDLTWKTLSETNNDKFEIWRAGEDKDFKKIAEVKGKGNSTQVSTYSFKDVSPLKGNNYYRLSQTDFDGTTEILAINFIYNGISRLQSNFFYNHDVIHLNIMDKPLEKVQFKILDIKGTNLFAENFYVKEAQDIQLKPQLNKGIYIGILEIDRQVFSRKFIVD